MDKDQKSLKKRNVCWGIGYAKYRRVPGGVERREKRSRRAQRASRTSDTAVAWEVEELKKVMARGSQKTAEQGEGGEEDNQGSEKSLGGLAILVWRRAGKRCLLQRLFQE